MFRHYRVILRGLVINTLPGFTSISNAAVGNTYSMVQGPSWAADWLAASQEIPRISRNPKVHYRTHKRPPPVPILAVGNTIYN